MFERFLKLIRSRQFYLGILIFIIIVMMVLKLFNLQIINGSVLNYYATKGYISDRTIEAPRGKIYDRNGRLIAYNRTGYNVLVYDRKEVKGDERNFMYYKLLKVFEKNGDRIDILLDKYITEDIELGVIIDDDAQRREAWVKSIVNGIYTKKVPEDDLKELKTARQIFDYLRANIFKVSEEYNEKDAYNIMAIQHNIALNG